MDVMRQGIETRQAAFTLVEMLGVILIVMTLIGILLPTVAKVRSKAKSARAQSEIETLSVALRMYESDLGKYPPNTSQVSNSLYNYLGRQITSGTFNLIVGPYMEFKADSLNSSQVYLDPWKSAYVYSSRDGSPAATNNTYSFDLSSRGPDGTANTSDDIKNW